MRQFNRTRFSAVDASYLPDEKEEYEAMTTLACNEDNEEEKENQREPSMNQENLIDEVEVPVKEKKSPLMKGEKSLFDELNDGTENDSLFT